MDFRFSAAAAAGAAAAPPFGGHFAVPPFYGGQQPPQRPLYPPIPDPRSAGLAADAARDLKKARTREEILAREAEQEVRRELQFARATAERWREVQQLGVFRSMVGAPENRFAEPRVGYSVPPPPNPGPYLLPYTPRAWGGEPQGSVQALQAPPRNLERPSSAGVPHCSEGERLGSVHHSGYQGSLLPIFHRLESAQAPDQLDLMSGRRSALPNDQRTLLPKADHPVADIGESLPSSSLPRDYGFFTRLGTGLLGHHPEVGFSGGPSLAAHPIGVDGQLIQPSSNLLGHHPEVGVSGGPSLAAHPIGVDGQPIRPPSNSDVKARNSGEDCSGKEKEKAKVKNPDKKAPPGSKVVCYRCGKIGHYISQCTVSNKEAKAHEKFMKRKRKRQALEGGNGEFTIICFKCGVSGHHQKDCVSMNEGDAPSQGSYGIYFEGGGSGHRQKDCLLLHEKGCTSSSI